LLKLSTMQPYLPRPRLQRFGMAPQQVRVVSEMLESDQVSNPSEYARNALTRLTTLLEEEKKTNPDKPRLYAYHVPGSSSLFISVPRTEMSEVRSRLLALPGFSSVTEDWRPGKLQALFNFCPCPNSNSHVTVYLNQR